MTPTSMRRRRTALALGGGIAATALVLAGCSGSPSGTETPDKPVALRMTVWTADETQLSMFQDIADAYVEEHPELVSKVTFEPVPFEDYTTSLTTQLAGGNAPDLGWILESYAPEFVSSGALADTNVASRRASRRSTARRSPRTAIAAGSISSSDPRSSHNAVRSPAIVANTGSSATRSARRSSASPSIRAARSRSSITATRSREWSRIAPARDR